jgi:hypothetical protein
MSYHQLGTETLHGLRGTLYPLIAPAWTRFERSDDIQHPDTPSGVVALGNQPLSGQVGRCACAGCCGVVMARPCSSAMRLWRSFGLGGHRIGRRRHPHAHGAPHDTDRDALNRVQVSDYGPLRATRLRGPPGSLDTPCASVCLTAPLFGQHPQCVSLGLQSFEPLPAVISSTGRGAIVAAAAPKVIGGSASVNRSASANVSQSMRCCAHPGTPYSSGRHALSAAALTTRPRRRRVPARHSSTSRPRRCDGRQRRAGRAGTTPPQAGVDPRSLAPGDEPQAVAVLAQAGLDADDEASDHWLQSNFEQLQAVLACCSPIALPARRRRACRLRDTRFRSR